MLYFISYVWSIDPEVFEIGSFFTLHWSVLVVGAGLFLSFEFFYRTISKEISLMKKTEILFLLGVLSSVFGARFFAAITKEGDFISNFVNAGFSLTGGILFLIIFCFLITNKTSKNHLFYLLDSTVFSLLIFLIFLQTSLFLESGNWGKQTESKYGIVFTNEVESILAGIFDKIEFAKIKSENNEAEKGSLAVDVEVNFIKELTDKQEVENFLNKDFKNSLIHYEVFNKHIQLDSLSKISFEVNQSANKKIQASISAIGVLRHPIMIYKALYCLFIIILLSFYNKKLLIGMYGGIGVLLLLCGYTVLDYLFAEDFLLSITLENSITMLLILLCIFYLFKLPKNSLSKTS